MVDKIKINLADLLDTQWIKIPVNECSIGGAQAAQSGRGVTEKDPLVISIRDMGGLIHPIVVKKIEGGYDIVTGQRRWNAHQLLNMSQIKAFVIEKDLTDAQRKVISFAENVGQKDMKHKDYVDVIEFFYDRYGGGRQGIIDAADTLGITTKDAKHYLKQARIPAPVQKCIDDKIFSQDIALKALVALGDDEESADPDMWIRTAKDLKLLTPSVRTAVAKAMKQHPEWTQQEAEDHVKEQAQKKENIIKIEATDSQIEKLESIQESEGLDDRGDTAGLVFDKGLESFD
jgi:ParB family chromosome partitioning protein